MARPVKEPPKWYVLSVWYRGMDDSLRVSHSKPTLDFPALHDMMCEAKMAGHRAEIGEVATPPEYRQETRRETLDRTIGWLDQMKPPKKGHVS